MTDLTLLQRGKIQEQKWMTSKEIAQIKTMQAVEFIIKWIDARRSKVLIVESGTASGKSTVLTTNIFKYFSGKCIVTEPRIVTCLSIVSDIVKYDEKFTLGKNIGYQTGFTKKYASEKNSLVFATTGVLKMQFDINGYEWVAKRYNFIIIDEVHERDIITDTVLAHIKHMMEQFKDEKFCPTIILMSATMPRKTLENYFDVPAGNYIAVEGFSYPITRRWLDAPTSNWIKTAVGIIKHIHCVEDLSNKEEMRDIIIFVKGANDIKIILELIESLNLEEKVEKCGLIYPIGLSRDVFVKGGKDYADILSPRQSIRYNGKIPHRRVIISTNFIETGFTIPTAKYIIDSGFVKKVGFDPLSSAKTMISSNITKFMHRQRVGRVGRKAPGIAYLLYTKDTYELFEDDQLPKIIIDEFTQVLLELLIEQTKSTIEVCSNEDAYDFRKQNGFYKVTKYESDFSMKNVKLMTLPPYDSIRYAANKLYMLGFINSDLSPTALGIIGSNIRKIRLESAKMILSGYQHGASIIDLITIAAVIESNVNLYDGSPFKYKMQTLKSNEISKVHKCEIIDKLFIWLKYIKFLGKTFSSANPLQAYELLIKWVAKNSFSLRGLQAVSSLRDEIIYAMLSQDLNIFYNGLDIPYQNYNLIDMVSDKNLFAAEIRKLKLCIYEGYRLSAATWNKSKTAYVSRYFHKSIALNSQLIRDKPNNILVVDLSLIQKKESNLYEFIGSKISIIDDL
jgi:HrpA-like RNA helicase